MCGLILFKTLVGKMGFYVLNRCVMFFFCVMLILVYVGRNKLFKLVVK